MLLFDKKALAAFKQNKIALVGLVILAGFVGKAIPPRAGGLPYVKEQ